MKEKESNAKQQERCETCRYFYPFYAISPQRDEMRLMEFGYCSSPTCKLRISNETCEDWELSPVPGFSKKIAL